MSQHGVTWGDEATLLAASVRRRLPPLPLLLLLRRQTRPDPSSLQQQMCTPTSTRPAAQPPGPLAAALRAGAVQGGDRRHLLSLGGLLPHCHAARGLEGVPTPPTGLEPPTSSEPPLAGIEPPVGPWSASSRSTRCSPSSASLLISSSRYSAAVRAQVPLRTRLYLGHYHEYHYVSTRPV